MSSSGEAGTTAERYRCELEILSEKVRARERGEGGTTFLLDERLTWMSVSEAGRSQWFREEFVCTPRADPHPWKLVH
jgi:hypothetical protein